MTTCTDCGGTIIEYDAAAGNGFCVQCGTVVEENTIVSEVTFGETSTGAAMVQGAYVGQGATHARMSGPFGNRGSSESREQTIANASRKIQSFATVLHLSEVVALSATRLYTLAVEHKFTKGRRSAHVAAVCLYVACRQKETRNYMLIDFSDLLQVNVFELGHIYLQLVQTLNLKLPLVDPSHYISRFAALLEFGDETHKVATDAVRLVQRFDRDWVTKGRRPAGICGAALLLAARMNNFRRSIEEIVQVVKIADTTLKKHFRTVWLDEEMDPPAFTKGKEREEREREDAQNFPSKAVSKKKRKTKRKKGNSESDTEDVEISSQAASGASPLPTIDPALFNQGILAGTTRPTPLFYPEDEGEAPFAHIDPMLRPGIMEKSHISTLEPSGIVAMEETVDKALAEEVATFLQNQQGLLLSEALDEAEGRKQSQFAEVDELKGLDEEEISQFILSEAEVKVKERVWVEINRDYLEALAAKTEQQQNDVTQPKSRKRRKSSTKPRDESTPSGTTAAESVRNLIKKNPKYSKRINYDALKDLFVDGDRTIPNLDDKEDLYSIDDKTDGDGMVVVEEGGGGVGSQKQQRRGSPETDADHLDEEASEKEDGIGDLTWEDAYEQEV
ncbi:hypothetical protein V8B97DRAFT_888451 [Scleroderma yunnanense]